MRLSPAGSVGGAPRETANQGVRWLSGGKIYASYIRRPRTTIGSASLGGVTRRAGPSMWGGTAREAGGTVDVDRHAAEAGGVVVDLAEQDVVAADRGELLGSLVVDLPPEPGVGGPVVGADRGLVADALEDGIVVGRRQRRDLADRPG